MSSDVRAEEEVRKSVKNSRYEYLFNVVCCNGSRNGEKLTENITDFLEKVARFVGKDPFKGYYVQRDLIPGKNMVEEFFKVFKISEFTILIVDDEFMKMRWDAYLNEVMTKMLGTTTKRTDEDMDRLLLIKLGEAEIEKLEISSIKAKTEFIDSDCKNPENERSMTQLLKVIGVQFDEIEDNFLKGKFSSIKLLEKLNAYDYMELKNLRLRNFQQGK